MKEFTTKAIIASLVLLTNIGVAAQEVRYKAPKGMKVVWKEEFNRGVLNSKNWDTISRDVSDWNRYMSPDPSLIYLENGNLVLEGRRNYDLKRDTSKYVTGGVESVGKFSFRYGRIDIRAKLDEAKGAWPALWLLPDVKGRRWPDDGEIDIMEHLNFDNYIYQTVHSTYTVKHKIKDNPKHDNTGKINRGEYNIYSVEWDDQEIRWFVNGIQTFSYKKLNTEQAQSKGQWPFDKPYYIILSQQLGGAGTWVGEINDDDLPVRMYIDWIRVCQLKDKQ